LIEFEPEVFGLPLPRPPTVVPWPWNSSFAGIGGVVSVNDCVERRLSSGRGRGRILGHGRRAGLAQGTRVPFRRLQKECWRKERHGSESVGNQHQARPGGDISLLGPSQPKMNTWVHEKVSQYGVSSLRGGDSPRPEKFPAFCTKAKLDDGNKLAEGAVIEMSTGEPPQGVPHERR
jgi:hypothetical protein